MAEAIAAVLDGRHPGLGAAARQAVTTGHDWETALARLDPLLDLRLPPPVDQEPRLATAAHG
jgi:hypothetical protein